MSRSGRLILQLRRSGPAHSQYTPRNTSLLSWSGITRKRGHLYPVSGALTSSQRLPNPPPQCQGWDPSPSAAQQRHLVGHGIRRRKCGGSVREDDCLQIDAFCFHALSRGPDCLGLDNWECCKSVRFSVDSGSHLPGHCRFSNGPM